MKQKCCPNCGWHKPRPVYPAEHYAHNRTPIEIEISPGDWKWFPSVTSAAAAMGVTKHVVYRALQRKPPMKFLARLAAKGCAA